MSLLLDTHYVFALAGSVNQLTPRELNFLATCPDSFVVSAVSIWEMRLKWDTLHLSGDRKGPLDPAQALRALVPNIGEARVTTGSVGMLGIPAGSPAGPVSRFSDSGY